MRSISTCSSLDTSAHHAGGDFILENEGISQGPVETTGPQANHGRRIDKPSRDTYPISFAQGSIYDVARTQPCYQLLEVQCPVLVAPGGTLADYPQMAESRQRGEHPAWSVLAPLADMLRAFDQAPLAQGCAMSNACTFAPPAIRGFDGSKCSRSSRFSTSARATSNASFRFLVCRSATLKKASPK
jgi:hypothetical protein